MALYELHPQKLCHSRYICIPSHETVENVTMYRILITIGKYYWSVSHRYSDFFELNEQLSAAHVIDRSLLPPKKIFGNQTESFIQRRKVELENYLKALFTLNPIPQQLVTFLEFDKYEIRAITEALASHLWENGDILLLSAEVFHMAQLQCHALTEQLKLPKSSTSKNPKTDIGHILDFLSKLTKLLICGSQKPVGSSNIIPNQLEFSMMPFKNLQSLKLVGCNPEMLKGLTNVRKTVVKLQVQDSLKNLKDFFLNDTLHWDRDHIQNESTWMCVKQADFSYNHLVNIDDSIYVLSHVETLDLSHNQISSIQHLDRLSHLTALDLSFNCFTHVSELHTKLGNIVSLKLVNNSIETLKGFNKLYSLVELDLQNNLLAAVTEITNLVNLPCLEKLNLTGNPITNTVDYRNRVLEQFNSRVSEIRLDNHLPTQKELDTVAVLQAIRRAKETASVKNQSNSDAVSMENGRSGDHIGVKQESHSGNLNSAGQLKSNEKARVKCKTDVEEFKQQVASIRAEGGAGWLRLWNQRQSHMHNIGAPTLPFSATDEETINSAIGDPVETFRTQSPIPSSFTDSTRELILPDWLPNAGDREFVASLRAQLSEVMNGKLNDTVYCAAPIDINVFFWGVILWCPSCIRCCKFPACVVVLQSCVVLFLLSDLENDCRPVLLPFRCISAKCIFSLNIGLHSHFLRFQERTVGDMSEYTLLLQNADECKLCAESLAEITSLNINTGLSCKVSEKCENANLYLAPQFYSWVAVDVDTYKQNEGCVICLAMNGSKIGLVQEKVCNLVLPSSTDPIKILEAWDAKDEILNLEIHSSQTEMTGQGKMNVVVVQGTSSALSVFTITNKVKQILTETGFGITIWFTERNVLSVRFPSREIRDNFLDTLTQART